MAERFIIGIPVYHKASLKRGVITALKDNALLGVVWEDGEYKKHIEAEFYTEEEGIEKIQQLKTCLPGKLN